MNAREYHEYLLKEAQIGSCWVIVYAGAVVLFIVQWLRDTTFQYTWTWITLGILLTVVVAGTVDDIAGRGNRNRKIRAAHAHLRKRNN